MKIQEIKRYRFEATEEELRAIAEMFQFYEDTAQDDDETQVRVRRSFGIVGSTQADEDERDETLPERAIRQSQGRRKSRIIE